MTLGFQVKGLKKINFMERKEKGRLPYGLIKEVIALAFSKYLDAIPWKHYPFLINVE